MKRKLALVLFIILIIPLMGHTDSLPSFTLSEGLNTITFVVTNSWNQDISGLTITIPTNSVPSWLSVKKSRDTLDIQSNTASQRSFTILVEVDNAPLGDAVELPLQFVDAKKNTWESSIQLIIQSDKPSAFTLYRNYPNPFNPTTTIRFYTPKNENIQLIIYNSLGQKVKTLIHDSLTAGMHSVQWNGINDDGSKVSSGVYFYRLQAGAFSESKRMTLIE